MRVSHWSAALLVLGSAKILSAEEMLATRLSRLDTVVAPTEERQSLADMVSSDIRRRRQELNDQNSAAWMKITGRQDWEQFRTAKLAALKTSLGQFPTPPQSLNLRVLGTVPGDGFRIDNIRPLDMCPSLSERFLALNG